MIATQDHFTSILIRRKVLTRSQLQGALLLQKQTNAALAEVLVEFGYVSREQVAAAMFVAHGVDELIDLTDIVIHRKVIALVRESVAREHVVIPIALEDGVLQLAMADPQDLDTLAKLLFMLDRKIQPLAAPREQILDCIDRHYGHTDVESVEECLHEFTDRGGDFELTHDASGPRTRRGKLTDSDSEFELTLNESREPKEGEDSGEQRDIFETHFDLQAAGSHPAALEEEDGDLESSDFDLAMEDSGTKSLPPAPARSRQTMLAMDDAARDDSMVTTSGSGGVFREEFEAMDKSLSCADSMMDESSSKSAPAAAAPTVMLASAAKPQAAPAPAGERLAKMSRSASWASAAEPKPMVERQATIRYYSQMAPERMFPLLVVISRKAIMEVVKRDVVQKQSKKFQVQMDSTVEIEPILPGCDCFPPKETVRISAAESSARFWVVPRVLGTVMHARVIVRQDGKVLAEVPLEMNVAKQTLTLCVGAMNFCVPFVSMLLKQSQLSLTSSEGGTGLLAAVVGWLLVMLSPEVMAGLLLLATVGLYFWLRPRQRDVFWDIQPAGAQVHGKK